MRYLLCYKWFFLLGALCLLSATSYSLFNRVDSVADETLLFVENFGEGSPNSLLVFNLKKPEQWQEYPVNGDLFTSGPSSVFTSTFDDQKLTASQDEPFVRNDPHSIQLDGWANIRGKMLFVFSSPELNTTFLGGVGDSFENPDFTILSVDFRHVENSLNKYPIPCVTILDKELNDRVVLTPASRNEQFQ